LILNNLVIIMTRRTRLLDLQNQQSKIDASEDESEDSEDSEAEEYSEEEEEEFEEPDEDEDDEPRVRRGFYPGAKVEAVAAAFGRAYAKQHAGERFEGVLKKKKKKGVWYVIYDEDGSVMATGEKYLRLVESQRETRQNRQQVCYADIDDGEFEALMHDEYGDHNQKRTKRKESSATATTSRKKKSIAEAVDLSESDEDDEDEDDDDDEESDSNKNEEEAPLEIERLLCRCTVSGEAWKANMNLMNTKEVMNGSMFIQEEDLEIGQRFLVKWKGMSYMHVSWETRSDLEAEIGQIETKRAITSLLRRFENGEAIELDCPSAKADVIEPTYFDVERILDILFVGDDRYLSDLGFELGIIKRGTSKGRRKVSSSYRRKLIYDTLDEKNEEDDEDGLMNIIKSLQEVLNGKLAQDPLNNKDEKQTTNISAIVAQILQNGIKSKKNATTSSTRSSGIKLFVKWRGLGYAEATYENIEDLFEYALERKDLEFALAKCLRRYLIGNSSAQTNGRSLESSHRNKPEIIRPYIPLYAYSDPLTYQLRDYQIEGTLWMIHNYLSNRSCVLADEMGLGKTVQTVSLVRMAKVLYKSKHPALIVAPLSTLEHWQREFSSWTNLDVCLYHGGVDDRERARKNDIFGGGNTKSASVDVIVTTYEQLLLDDARSLAKLTYSIIVIDEAHRLKNPNSRLYKTLIGSFSTSDYNSRIKVLLTGTPLQNDVKELWSILAFCDPDEFGECDDFVAQYSGCGNSIGALAGTVAVARDTILEQDKENEQSNLNLLLERMRPYVLRREKSHVEKSVPPKSEIVVEVALAPTQKRWYRALYENKVEMLVEGKAKDGPALTNLAMELRKCCNHPFLLRGVENSHYLNTQNFFDRAARRTSHDSFKHTKAEVDTLVDTCGKLQFLDKLLPDRKNKNSKVLIFSQFTMMLNVLEDYLEGRNYDYGRIDGGVTGRDRQRQIDQFCAPDSQIFVMLLSTRAGGVGINLVAADTVVIYDSDWNPQNDVQAMARCHRIGQTKPVSVFRLLTSGTYESHMYDVATAKLDLDRAVLDGMAGKRTMNKSSRQLQENLLRRGATALAAPPKRSIVEGENEDAIIIEDNDFATFKNQDLDSILKTRSRQVILSRNEGGGALESLSTATFAINKNADEEIDVDLDDPEFWKKTLGSALEENQAQRAKQDLFTDKSRTAKAKVSYKEEKYDSFFLAEESTGRKRRSGKDNLPPHLDDSDDDLSNDNDYDENIAPNSKKSRGHSVKSKKAKKEIDHKNHWKKSHLHALKQQVSKRGIGKSGDEFICGNQDLIARAALTSSEEIKAAARIIILSHAQAMAYVESKRQANKIQSFMNNAIDDRNLLVEAAKRIIFRYKAVRKAVEEAAQIDSATTIAAAHNNTVMELSDDGPLPSSCILSPQQTSPRIIKSSSSITSSARKRRPPACDNDNLLGKYIIDLKISSESNLNEICFTKPASANSLNDLSEEDVKQSRLLIEKCHYQEVIRLVVERLNHLKLNGISPSRFSTGGSQVSSPRNHPKIMSFETKLRKALGENEPPVHDLPGDGWWKASHDCALLQYADQNGSVISEKFRIDFLFGQFDFALPDHVVTQVLALKEFREATTGGANTEQDTKVPPSTNLVPTKEKLKARLNALVITAIGPLPRGDFGSNKEPKKKKPRAAPSSQTTIAFSKPKQQPSTTNAPVFVDLTSSDSPEKSSANTKNQVQSVEVSNNPKAPNDVKKVSSKSSPKKQTTASSSLSTFATTNKKQMSISSFFQPKQA